MPTSFLILVFMEMLVELIMSKEYRDILEKSQSVLTRLTLSIFSAPNLRLSLEDITGNYVLVSEKYNNIISKEKVVF